MCRHNLHGPRPLSRLLDDSGRAVVWPDSVQVLGGSLSFAAAHPNVGVALYRFAVPPSTVPVRGSRGDCPARNSTARPVS